MLVFTNEDYMIENIRLTNLLETFASWTEDVDKGFNVDVIFLGFLKSL